MGDSPSLTYDGEAIRTTVDLRSYRLSAVKKTAYRLAARCTAILGSPTETELPVLFTFKPGTLEPAARDAVRAFFEELLDQELREDIAQETAPLRALILAQAFSKTDLIGHE